LAEKYGTLKKSNKTEGNTKIIGRNRPNQAKRLLFLNTLPLSQCLCVTVWVSVLHMYTTDIDINAKETSQK
jgi:hypothetical protein